MTSLDQNFILSGLDPTDLAQLKAASRQQPLTFGEVVFRSGDPVQSVVFPETGVISLITQAPDGTQAEAAVIGSEGGGGLSEALGSGVMSTHGVVQADGSAWFVPVRVCRDLYDRSRRFRRVAALALEFQGLEARQSVHCRSYHAMPQRLARWLLEMRDKSGVEDDTLNITQEFLSIMLGVQRTTVSAIAQQMQAQGMLRYARGRMLLRDMPALEAQACPCRAELKDHYQRIFNSEAGLGGEAPRGP